MRLQKYMAQCGVASRRKAEEMIRMGRVSMNGQIITEMGMQVNADDIILVDGVQIKQEERKRYIMLHKPCGYVTTANDQFGRPTVMDLVQVEERVYPIGRLDYHTSGLLLLTNDGEFANQMMHPSKEIRKIYKAKLKGTPNTASIETFQNGIMLDGKQTAKAQIEIVQSTSNGSIVRIIIHEGRNRQVRRMCESIGHRVLELCRIQIGELALGDLKEGVWQEFCPTDV